MKDKTDSIDELRAKALVHLAAAVAACHGYRTARGDRRDGSVMRKVAIFEGEFVCRSLLIATAPDVNPDILRRLVAMCDEMRAKYAKAKEVAERLGQEPEPEPEPECAIRRVTKITIE